MNVLIWITGLRGLCALGLGVSTIVAADAVRPRVVNFMGLFLLAGGLTALRSHRVDEGARGLDLVAACAEILAGAAVLARFALSSVIPETPVIYLLAVALVVTGALHVTVANRRRERLGAARSWLTVGLGALELALGALLVAAPLERGRPLHALLIVWAILAGSLLVAQAWSMRSSRPGPAEG
jgi:uncharacterized membrane protein HdeD (DUF308 family)